MTRLGLALGCAALASACSLLLDTESLQKKTTSTSTGTGGTGGTGGSGGAPSEDAGTDAPAADAGKTCTADSDCLPGLDIDGCTIYACAVSPGAPAGTPKTCQPPKPNSGALGVSSVGPIDTVITADDIGYPSVIVVGSDILLGVYHKTGTTTDVRLRRYLPNQTPIDFELSAVAPNTFEGYGSSPGMIGAAVLTPRRVRLLLAADPVGAAPLGMHLVDVDVPLATNVVKLSMTQPLQGDLGVTGYNTAARTSPPRMVPPAGGNTEPGGLWVQQQQLYYFDGATLPATSVFSTKHVTNVSPLAGPGIHAVLQTADVAGAAGNDRTEIWSLNSAGLVSLDGDQPGLRRGVSSTSTNENGLTANLIGWAFQPNAMPPQTNFSGAACSAMTCAGFALTTQSNSIPYAAFPELTSVRVTNSMSDRDLLETFQLTVPDSTQPTVSQTVGFASLLRLTIPTTDATKITSKPINPAPVFPFDIVPGPATAAPGDVLGPSSVANTADGQLLITWVVRQPSARPVLRARRYTIKACP